MLIIQIGQVIANHARSRKSNESGVKHDLREIGEESDADDSCDDQETIEFRSDSQETQTSYSKDFDSCMFRDTVQHDTLEPMI